MTEINRQPVYLQVLAQLRERITTGALAEGEHLPSERQIAEQWKISRTTATKILASLRAEGLVESIHGVGTVVRAREVIHRTPQDRFARMLATGKIYAPGEYARIVSSELAATPAHVADALGVDEGEVAIRRHRVTWNESGPVSASTSWFHAELAESVPALLETERIKGGTPSAIEAATGRRAKSVSDRFTAAEATVEQAEELQIPVGSPVIVGHNTLYDAEGNVLEVGEYVSPGGRWSLYEGRIEQ